MDMRFGTWNVRSTYGIGSLRAVAEEISKYKSDLVGVQESLVTTAWRVLRLQMEETPSSFEG
jgi:hypothetical protein